MPKVYIEGVRRGHFVARIFLLAFFFNQSSMIMQVYEQRNATYAYTTLL